MTPLTCPECGGQSVYLVDVIVVETYHPGYHVAGTPLPTRHRETQAVACMACEFIEEVRDVLAAGRAAEEAA